VSGETVESVALTQRELLLEMRADMKALRADMVQISRDQAVAVERRSSMFDRAKRIDDTLADHADRIQDLEAFEGQVTSAVRLGRWAFGASGLAAVIVIVQLVSGLLHAANPSIPQVP
jgi:hypothetical protein